MAKPKPEDITAIVDTREQVPLELERYGLKTVVEKLPFGDYSLANPDLRKYLVIERKSLSDLVSCCTWERERFEKEMLALRGYSYCCVVCECNMSDIFAHVYRSKTNPNAVIASISSWLTWGIPFLMAGNERLAAYVVAKLLFFKAREYVEYARAIYNEQ